MVTTEGFHIGKNPHPVTNFPQKLEILFSPFSICACEFICLLSQRATPWGWGKRGVWCSWSVDAGFLTSHSKVSKVRA